MIVMRCRSCSITYTRQPLGHWHTNCDCLADATKHKVRVPGYFATIAPTSADAAVYRQLVGHDIPKTALGWGY